MALLDAGDRSLFHDRAARQYPLYQRGAHAPAEVLLLRRGAHWLYVTFADAGDRRGCVTAVFAAERFDITRQWLAKYQPRPGVFDD